MSSAVLDPSIPALDEVIAPVASFDDIDLPAELRRAVDGLGFTIPSPIQAQAIPLLLAGRDITGVAQTGTGKTAAFGLPLLNAVDAETRGVQALVLTPTRELAMQVSEAISTFAQHVRNLSIVTVYGGAPFLPQKSALARGAQVVVGTPGRVIDHLERHTLDLSNVRFLVLDEADEMLRMGFAEDVDRILSESPRSRQTALFSATMPSAIRKVAQTHMNNPIDITVEGGARATTTVEQTYAVVPFRQKVDVLGRVLQMQGAGEKAPASIIFVRTKSACDEVAMDLSARGIAAASLNGDVAQKDREKIVEKLRSGAIDVLVATDVAARGLDVERIGLVVNFDAPREAETYTHRIGRTGRAGRTGKALTFFTPREIFQVRVIERVTGAKLTQITPPTAADVAKHRTASVLAGAAQRVQGERIEDFRTMLTSFSEQQGVSIYDMAAALLATAAGDDGSRIVEIPQETFRRDHDAPRGGGRSDSRGERGGRFDREPAGRFGRSERPERGDRTRPEPRRARTDGPAGPKWRVAVGRNHGVRPAGIVGAITGEGGINGRDLGRIDIFDTYSVVEIASPLSTAAVGKIAMATVSGQKLRIRREQA
ncbi:DEAD/DEAH box helicase [Nakamurella sp. A5-74]|uniref:RNA helicase n=1 Tax=Nakamurella sp. A5-74 TaxID=3158264 RepID=A0AAU8DM55_9ACTN